MSGTQQFFAWVIGLVCLFGTCVLLGFFYFINKSESNNQRKERS